MTSLEHLYVLAILHCTQRMIVADNTGLHRDVSNNQLNGSIPAALPTDTLQTLYECQRALPLSLSLLLWLDTCVHNISNQ
jgi:hypothetical protein